MLAEVEALKRRVDAQLEHHERLGVVVVTADEWLIANGMLTPTTKIKRQALEERHASGGERWLAAGAAVVACDG